MSLCTQFSTAAGCFTDAGGAKQEVVIHYEYGANAAGASILVATRFADADGTPIDTSGGTVAAGACPVIPADVEWELLQDVDEDGVATEFFRRSVTTFDAAGSPTTVVTDFELDKTTAYTVTGDVTGSGNSCSPATAVGVVATWG